MEKSKKSINMEGGFLFCGGWNFSKLVSVGSTFIREMRVSKGKRISNGNYGIMAYGLGWTVKKRGWADYEQILRPVFFTFLGSNFFLFFLETL